MDQMNTNVGEKPIVTTLSLLDDIVLDENDLTEEAKHQFPLHTEIFHAFEINRRAILENNLLTPIGRHIELTKINQRFTESKLFLNYVAINSELLRNTLPQFGPLVICGIPRTGTTMLYNLLACDQNSRAPLITDMYCTILPPIPRSNLVEYQRRANIVRAALQLGEQLTGRTSAVAASHALFPIGEDHHIVQQAGFIMQSSFICTSNQIEIDKWSYDNTSKSYAYAYHEMFLRMLNSVDPPKSHWLLKWPAHSICLDKLFDRYPNAAVVMSHRRLDEVLPSFFRLLSATGFFYFDETDVRASAIFKTRAIRHIDRLTEHVVEFRQQLHHLKNSILDISYTDLMKEPIATVRRIYDHFGLRWSQEFEMAMNTWLKNNPQGKQGRHTYSLAELDLTPEDIKKRYSSYIGLFQHLFTTSNDTHQAT